ncbi:MAG: hypothetical protein U0670_22120 [Anaerolineae bacterium]
MIHYAAKPYVAGTTKAEVIGQTVLAFVDNLESEVIAPLLPKYGLVNIDPDKWYPHQSWMNVLKELGDMPGSTPAFVAFGRRVVETAVMPPEIKSIPEVLNLLHAIHHMNLRNIPDEEGYLVEAKGDRHYWVYHNTPNPDDAIYGFIWGMVARYKQPDEQFVVRLIPNPHPDVHPGSLYEIKWRKINESLD